MAFMHEKLDVYRLALLYTKWALEHSRTLPSKDRIARDQWIRAATSIPLNIAEGNGKTAANDRRRFFEIARGSVLECAAIQDILVLSHALDESISVERKGMLDRVAGMLTRLGGRGYRDCPR